MKTVGRGRDYQKALELNLIRSLQIRKNITTTRARARMLMKIAGKRGIGTVTLTPVAPRGGDNAPQVLVQLVQKEVTVPKEKNENRTDKKQSNRKKVASR